MGSVVVGFGVPWARYLEIAKPPSVLLSVGSELVLPSLPVPWKF